MKDFDKMFVYHLIALLMASITYVVTASWNHTIHQMFNKIIKPNNPWLYPLLVTILGVILAIYLEKIKIKFDKKELEQEKN
jgi:uncharacterized membrane protein (DUF106 family)